LNKFDTMKEIKINLIFMIFVKIFYGILLFTTGLVIIKYRKIVYEWTGKFIWAEKYL